MVQNPEVFTAGFARVDITPRNGGIPLAGYGATSHRLAAFVLDRLYANIVAFGTGDKAEFVLITWDISNCNNEILEILRKAISERTGLPETEILIGGTHTHSAPDLGSKLDSIAVYKEYLVECLTDAVPRAIRDLRPAKIFYGKETVGHEGSYLNFCRHYKLAKIEDLDNLTDDKIEFCGDNFNGEHMFDKEHYTFVGHEEDVDHNLQMIKLAREDADDIVMLNFQAHGTITGGGKKTNLSSDYPGATVKAVEALMPNTKCIYYNGACGNINPNSRMISDSIPGLTFGGSRSHYAYAAVLAAYAVRISKNLTESKSTKIGHKQYIFVGRNDHSMDHRKEDAKKVSDLFRAEGYTDEVRALFRSLGFNSPYQCNAIVGKAERPETAEFEINALRFGDVGMTTSIGEQFNDLGVRIKAESPFAMTFVKCYSCGSGTYFPSKGSCENSYERNTTRFVPGTGELVVKKLVEMLTDLYQE